MKKHMPRKESGQILVVFSVVLVALLGLTALAVDGGMVYSDRRAAQNVADTAALAGAGAAAQYFENHAVRWDNFTCSGADVIGAINAAKSQAISSAGNNFFTIDTNVSDSHGVTVDCNIINHGSYKDKYFDVRTYITAKTNTSFAHLFYSGEMVNTVEAVVRLRPRTSLAYGYAVMSLSDDCGTNAGGVYYDGNSSLKINGGGVFSSSCMTVNGSPLINVSGPLQFSSGTIPAGDLANYTNQQPVPAGEAVPIDVFPPPDCSSVPLHPDGFSSIAASGTYNPGRYDEIKLVSSDDVVLNPGLYCVTGSHGIAVSGDLSNDPAAGGVTIYVEQGSVSISGGVVRLYAPTVATSAAQGISGMLFYMAEGNANPLKVEGNSDTAYKGTIYAPSGTVEIGGTSGTSPTFTTQLIAQIVKLHGTANIDINFQPVESAQYDPKLDMYK